MVTKDNIFCNGEKREITSIHLDNAKSVIERGLKYFVGDNYQWASEYNEIVDWLDNNKHKGLLCYGNVGRGKSLICENILPNIFRYYLRLNLWKFDGFSINDKREQLRECDCAALIDDFGVESISKKFGESTDVFSEFITFAEKRKQLVILSTNLTLDEIKAKYGVRTLDRLVYLTHPVLFTGQSFRR